mmetsp:Transcript_19857/g.26171  ORF Transcript_19857/g.26171 Transcript_19857/m.26171 type:complete len:342 (+) Transcript_19857:244-1269(+)
MEREWAQRTEALLEKIHKIQGKLESKEEDIEKVKRDKKQLEQKLSIVLTEIEVAKVDFQRMKHTLEGNATELQNELRKTKKELEHKSNELHDAIENMSKIKTDHVSNHHIKEQELKLHQIEVDLLKQELLKLQETIGAKEKEIEQLLRQKDYFEDQLARMAGELLHYYYENEDLDNQNYSLQQFNDSLQENLSRSQELEQKKLKDLSEAESQLSTFKHYISRYEQQKEQEVVEVQKDLMSTSQELHRLKDINRSKKGQLSSLAKHNRSLAKQFALLKRQIKQATEEKEHIEQLQEKADEARIYAENQLERNHNTLNKANTQIATLQKEHNDNVTRILRNLT